MYSLHFNSFVFRRIVENFLLDEQKSYKNYVHLGSLNIKQCVNSKNTKKSYTTIYAKIKLILKMFFKVKQKFF